MEVRDKHKALHKDLDAGVRPSASYTVKSCIEDWLASGLTSRQPDAIENYTRMADHAIARLGAVRLALAARIAGARGRHVTVTVPRLLPASAPARP